jgi:septal ring factor EnvC (AmiA/AmiB activator)
MQIRFLQLIPLWLIIVYLAISPAFANAPLTKKNQELQTITVKIQQLQKNLTSITTKRYNVQHTLKNIEAKMGGIAKRIDGNKSQLAQKKKILHKLSLKQLRYKTQLNTQKKLLAKQVYAAYILGRQPYLKIILNQENPQNISRYLHYYGQLNQARIKIIKRIKLLAIKIDHTTKNYANQTKKLQKEKHILQANRINFTRQKNQRQQLLTNINKDLRNKNKMLHKLLVDKTQLEKIIAALNAEQNYGYVQGEHFIRMHHKLHWPINGGHVTQTFGQTIAAGRMHATGILLAAPTGTKVHAIFPGKVVFANWLHGFGLLVIIQHEQKYMTLYGRNQSLYVKRGEIVKAGQEIATVGNSGGFQNSGLYFEIRHNARPINPFIWLSKHA